MATFKASGETVIPRAAKDGTNGVGISSADVVFTVAEASAAPTAKSSWVSEFTNLTLAEGKYVWCATKTVYTNGTTAYTGIYQLGKCEDFAGVTEQYALSDSPTTAPTSGWAAKYTPTQGKYLWTRTQYTYKAGSTSSYSTPTCVGYFATNGTSFTPKGTAAAHYANYAAIGSITSEGVYILVDDASGFPSSKCSSGSSLKAAPSVAQYVNAPDYTWHVWPAESGDAYRVDTNLWVNNGTAWVDFGDIQGPEGDPGEDAVNVLLSCSTLTFEWEDGNYADNTEDVTVQLSKGGAAVPTTDYTVEISEATSYNSNRVSIQKGDDAYMLIIPADGITMTQYTEQNLDDTTQNYTVTYPVSTATIVLAVTDKTTGTTVYETLTVNVNFTKLYGSVTFNDKSLRSTYSKVTSLGGEIERCNSKITQTATSINAVVSANKTELEGEIKTNSENISKIEQTASSISLKVSTMEAGLEATGIDIENKKVTVTADNFVIKNNSNEEALHSDSEGNLVVSGTVTAASGKIGAFTIKDTGLHADGFAGTNKQHATTFDVTNDGLSMVFDSDNTSTQSWLKYGCSAYGTLLRWNDTENSINFNLGRWGQEDSHGLEYTRKYTDATLGGDCTITAHVSDHIMVSRVPQSSSYASYGNWCEISSSATNQVTGFTGLSVGPYSSGTKEKTVQLGTVRAKYGNGNFDTYAKLKMLNLPYIPNTSNSTYLAIYNSLEKGQVYIGENNVLKIKP